MRRANGRSGLDHDVLAAIDQGAGKSYQIKRECAGTLDGLGGVQSLALGKAIRIFGFIYLYSYAPMSGCASRGAPSKSTLTPALAPASCAADPAPMW